MMNLINYLVKDFAMKELDKARDYAETEARKLGDILKGSIEEGVHNAAAATMPLLMKTGLYLIGGAFFLYGFAKIIDSFTTYPGLGFMVVGCIALIVALLIGKRR